MNSFRCQAAITDKLALVRSLQFVEPMQHELEEVYTGFPKSAHRPAFGSVISRFRGGDGKMPSYVSLEYSEGTSSYENPQYVGAAHRPLHISGTVGVRNLGLMNGMTHARLGDRRGLLRTFDTLRHDLDTRRETQNMDAYTGRAFDIIASPRVRDAFDLSREPDKVRDRYGDKDEKFTYVGKAPDSYWYGQNFLLARRLVEAGVPIVTLRTGLWDHHGNVIQQIGGVSIWHSLRSALPLSGSFDSHPGHRPARPRPRQGSAGPGLGRVRPYTEDRAGRPRPLARRQLRSLRRRRPHRPGDRRNG